MNIIDDSEWKMFVDDNLVKKVRLRSIAIKITKSVALSLREKAIFESRTNKINEIIIKIKKSKQP